MKGIFGALQIAYKECREACIPVLVTLAQKTERAPFSAGVFPDIAPFGL